MLNKKILKYFCVCYFFVFNRVIKVNIKVGILDRGNKWMK